MEKIVSNCILFWMCFVSFFIGLLHNQTSESNDFYNFGPSDNLVILGFIINTYQMYSCIIGYCFINSILRSLFHNLLTPWVTNFIQDKTREKPKNIHRFAYESAYIITLYTWFDWFLYYNILISQIDLLLVEIIIDLIMAGFVTYYYLNLSYFDELIPINKSELIPINKSEFFQIINL